MTKQTKNTISYDTIDKNRSGRNAETITAILQIIPEKQEPSSNRLTSQPIINDDDIFLDIPEEEVRTVDATVAHPYTVEKYSDDDEDPYLEREDINEEEIITLNTVSNNHPHKGEEYGEDDKDIYLEMKNIDKGKTLQLDSATSVVPHDGEEYDDDDEDIDDVEEIGTPSTVKDYLISRN